MNNEVVVPAGCWENSSGGFTPSNKIKAIDKDRDAVVCSLCSQALAVRDTIATFKAAAMAEVTNFIERSLAAYDVQHGGKKGNVTLLSFDGRYKIIRQMQDNLVFDERLQAARVLIAECVQTWSKGSNNNIKVLVNDAFQVDKQGNISVSRVLGLRRLKIDDEKWLLAMRAIDDSIQVLATKPYIRFYERNDAGDYVPISLDSAAL